MTRYIFKFAGGPLDGKTVTGELGEGGEAQRYYALTHHGRVGQRFRTASPYAVSVLARERLKQEAPHGFQQHLYQVMDRVDNGKVVLVFSQYVQKSPRDPPRSVTPSTPDPDQR